MSDPNIEHRDVFGNAVGSTLATTLYARAKGAELFDAPGWDDPQAREAWSGLQELAHQRGQDLEDIVLKDEMDVVGTINRSKDIDERVREFASHHEHIQVVSLGIGLCNRASRLSDLDASWYGVDNSDVIALREQLLPGDQTHHISGSVTDPAWLVELDPALPTVLIAEGLFMYLSRALVAQILVRSYDHFTSSLWVIADIHHSIATMGPSQISKLTGARFRFGVRRPEKLAELAPGWKLIHVDDIMASIRPAAARVSKTFRKLTRGLLYGVLTIEAERS